MKEDVTKYTWDCFMCGAKQTMESSHQYFKEKLGKMVPAGYCKCTACGNGGLACPQSEGFEGTLGVEGKA